MPIPSTIADLSTTAASNSPSGSDSPTEGDNYLRAIQAILRQTYDDLLPGGNLWSSAISAAPSSLGNHDSIVTAFDGDISKILFPVDHRITGAATLGQPTTGYTYTPEAYPHYTYLYNSSGYNHDTAGNTGRTSAVAYRTKVFNTGQGDCVAYNASGFVTGTRAGSTHFLANPAVTLFNGDVTAGAAGTYLNPYETILHDGGYDVAAIGAVYNMDRTVSTGAKSAIWLGLRLQSIGAAYCDALMSATGKWKVGLSFSQDALDLSSNVAVALKSGQRIAFNDNSDASGATENGWYATGHNGDYIAHTTSGFTGLNFVISGTSRLQLSATQATLADIPLAVSIGGAVAYVRGLQSGFALPTGTANTATFNVDAIATVADCKRAFQWFLGLAQRLHSSTSGAHALIGV
jgi:hypothetical protein